MQIFIGLSLTLLLLYFVVAVTIKIPEHLKECELKRKLNSKSKGKF